MNYPIYDIYHSFQGEGCFMGQSAVFIRFSGCNLNCKFCDSQEYKDVKWRYTEDEIVKIVKESPDPDFVVLTGGEPALYDLPPLLEALHLEGYRVHLETNGTLSVGGDFDWICVSPKHFHFPRDEMFEAANEFKVVVESPEQIETYLSYFRKKGIPFQRPYSPKVPPIWLHPEWSQRQNRKLIKAIYWAVVRYGYPLRAGWQIHKQYYSK